MLPLVFKFVSRLPRLQNWRLRSPSLFDWGRGSGSDKWRNSSNPLGRCPKLLCSRHQFSDHYLAYLGSRCFRGQQPDHPDKLRDWTKFFDQADTCLVTIGQTSNVTAAGFSLPTLSGSGATATAVITGVVSALNLSSGGSGYTSAPAVTISGGSGSGATPYAVIGTVSGSPQFGQVIAVVLQNPGTGYTASPAPTVSFSGGGGSGAAATATVLTSGVTSYIVTNGGSGYTVPPFVSFPTPSTGQTVPVAVAVISGGSVTAINVVAQGSGYTTPPAVTLVSSLGIYVGFSTTGNLPSPLVEGASYLAGPPNSGSTFTITNDDFTPVNITDTGSGTLYLDITRSFSVAFTNTWGGDFSNTPSGTGIYFGTDSLLPSTTPSIDNGATQFYLKRLTNNTAQIYSDSGLGSLVTINSFGEGQTYYAIQQTANLACTTTGFR